MNEKLKGFVHNSFIAVFFFILLLGMGRTLFFPKDFNVYENRYAKKLSEPSAEEIIDGTFQNGVEDSLADQIPLAQYMKKAYNLFTRGGLNALVSSITVHSERYIRYFGVNLYRDHMVYTLEDLVNIQPSLDNKAENYNALIRVNPDVDFYAFYIEKDTDINFETGEKSLTGDYMLSLLDIPATNHDVFRVQSYNDFSENFYRTDHHWNHRGSYEGYRQLVRLLCKDAQPMQYGVETFVCDSFYGSKALTAGSQLMKDRFYAYTFSFPEYTVTENGSLVSDYGKQSEYLADDNIESITYGMFYGEDSGEVIFDSANDEAENILLIGESFDNAILKLIASHFNKTFSVDLRNYEHFMGHEFDLNQYVKENAIDKVLFIGNSGFWMSTDFMIGSK